MIESGQEGSCLTTTHVIPGASKPVETAHLEDAVEAAIAETPRGPRSVDVDGLCRRLRMAVRSLVPTVFRLQWKWDCADWSLVREQIDLCETAVKDGGPWTLLTIVNMAIPVLAAAVDYQKQPMLADGEYAAAVLELRTAHGELLRVSGKQGT